jgi:hypothetical protein
MTRCNTPRGGAIRRATLNSAADVAFAPDGTMYIADTFNCAVRTVSDGVIATLAGNGNCTFGGDGGCLRMPLMNPFGTAVGVYIADTFNVRAYRVRRTCPASRRHPRRLTSTRPPTRLRKSAWPPNTKAAAVATSSDEAGRVRLSYSRRRTLNARFGPFGSRSADP